MTQGEMMDAPVEDDDKFLAFLKRHFGTDDVALERLPISCTSRVYRVRVADGAPLFCKRKVAERHVADFFRKMPPSPHVVSLLENGLLEFAGEYVFLYPWCEVKPVALVDMSEVQFQAFAEGCHHVHALLQHAPDVRPPRDEVAWMENVKKYCRRYPLARFFFRSVLRMRPEDYRYPAGTELPVTHGDFHTHNFGFTQEGRLVFLDFDLMIRALYAEDITHLVINGMRHSYMLFDRRRRSVLLSRYETLVRSLPYPLADWRLALNRERLWSASGVIDGKGETFKAAREFLRRDLPTRFMYGVLDKLAREG